MMFVQRLAATAERVESRLQAILQDCAPDAGSRLGGAMRHAVLGGGKRFRPFLVIESAGLFGLAPEDAVHAAAAVELIHCYSLVHDDLPCMDDDDVRRGRPTVHKAYDEWTAVLAGDALLTLAFETLAAERTHKDARVRAELVLALSRAAGGRGMVEGQMIDLEADKLGRPAAPTVAHVRRLQSLKTGALIRAACEMGAILGTAAASERAALSAYGAELGLAFQIADDLLDAGGDALIVGKATGKDGVAGKATLVSLLGVAEAEAALRQAEAAAIAAVSPFGEKAAGLIEAARFAAARAR